MDEIKEIKESTNKLLAPEKLKILVTIVNKSKADFYTTVLQSYDVNMQYVMYAKGTAPISVDPKYLQESHKVVIFSVIKAEQEKEILNAYEDKYFKVKNTRGVAFTISMSSIIGISIYQFLANLE